MPLKHSPETFFVFLLILVLVATGFILSTLPMLPQGSIPWLIVFAVTFVYPAVLMPFFRSERADHEFRSLHWFPMTMTLLWLLFALLAWFLPSTAVLLRAYTWAWSLPMVAFATIGLLLFCSKVIRQWLRRTVLILLAFVPFAVLAVYSTSGPKYEASIAKSLWSTTSNPAQIASIPADTSDNEVEVPAVALIDVGSTASTNSDSSEAAQSSAVSSALTSDESAWQMFLQNYSEPSVASTKSAITSSDASVTDVSSSDVSSAQTKDEQKKGFFGFFRGTSSLDSVDPVPTVPAFEGEAEATVSAPLIGQNSSTPTHLPKSGFGLSAIALSLFALYVATVHRRQLARA